MDRSTFTHLALIVADADASVDFYRRYLNMEVVHERTESTGTRVVWLLDDEKPFVMVLIAIARPSGLRALIRKASQRIARLAYAPTHLGFSCASREQVDTLCELARREGRLRQAPHYHDASTGYYGMLSDPDGHNVELSFGQDVGLRVERTRRQP